MALRADVGIGPYRVFGNGPVPPLIRQGFALPPSPRGRQNHHHL